MLHIEMLPCVVDWLCGALSHVPRTDDSVWTSGYLLFFNTYRVHAKKWPNLFSVRTLPNLHQIL